MKLNRNNYEMFFLLYVDNELSAEERIAVETFVAENTDLKPELDLLAATTLSDDAVVFTGKKDLYREELNEGLLQEKLLLHLDNELDPSAAALLEKQISAQKDLQQEWNILQQVKLDAGDKIIFENKQSLYRYENSKLVSMRFRRVAVAAAIIGIGLFIGIPVFIKSNKQQDVVTAGKNNNLPGNKIISPVTTTVISARDNRASAQQTNDNLPLAMQNRNDSSDVKVKQGVVVTQNNMAVQQQPVKESVNKTILPKSKASFENINNPVSNEAVSSTVKDHIKTLTNKNQPVMVAEKEMAKVIVEVPAVPLEDKEITLTRNSYAKNAVLDQSSAETDDNHVLFINEEKINRSKMSGLFRKVKRVITRNANVKTGNSVKIAGFEIAAR